MLDVQRITTDQAEPFILDDHYLHRSVGAVHHFGLFEDGQIVGIICYSVPAGSNVAASVCGHDYAKMVLHLSRLVVKTETHCAAGVLISHSLRLLPRRPCIVLTYADQNVGHLGTVYKATNAIYTGESSEVPMYETDDGEIVNHRHSETKNKIRTIPQLPKHRYVYFIGSRTDKRRLREALLYPVLRYPEGVTKRAEEAPTEPLTENERGRLTELESVIERGLKSFVEVGNALNEIRRSRLYRQEYKTFEQYCRYRWNLSRIHGHRLIDAAEVYADLLPVGNIHLLTNERQARELVPLKSPEKRREAWTLLTAPGAPPPTAKRICRVVQEVKCRVHSGVPNTIAGADWHWWEESSDSFVKYDLRATILLPHTTDPDRLADLIQRIPGILRVQSVDSLEPNITRE